MSYNGWTNRSTWNINLWMMNDEACYEAWKAFKRHWGFFTSENAYTLARSIFVDKTPDDVEIEDPEID